MRRIALAALASAVLLAPAAPAAAQGLDLRVGAFFPRADSNLFRDDEILYTVSKSDWTGVFGGAEYSHRLGENVELGVSIDYYERQIDTAYRDYVDGRGNDIFQTLRLEMVPVGVTLKFVAGDRFKAVQPYIGVGADLVAYKYEEFGEFIDFDGRFDIYDDAFISESVTFGLHGVAGLRVPFGDDFALALEGRYLWAKDDMPDDFRGNEIDLSGASATIGLHVRF
jgi:opacity protein-like surface antigen